MAIFFSLSQNLFTENALVELYFSEVATSQSFLNPNYHFFNKNSFLT